MQLRKKVSWKLFAKVLAGLFVFYLLFSYFAVNPLAKKLVPKIAEKSLASKASVGSVAFDPFRFKATINDFKLAKQSGESLASFKKLVVDLELSGMFDLAWKFKQVNIVEPHANLAIASNGQFNWDSLMAKLNEKPSPPSDTMPRLIIEHIVVNQGKVDYEDANRSTPINTTLAPLNFELKGFSTLPKDRGDYLISAAFSDNGGSLKWKGELGVNPIASEGVVSIEGVKIAEVLQLVKGLALPIKLSSGDLQTSFNYNFALPKTLPTLALNNLTLSLRDVAGELAEGGRLTLSHAMLSAPQLSFVKSKQPTLIVKNLGFKLTDLSLSQHDAMQVTLKESSANLPQLDFAMQDKPQMSFEDLNVKFADFKVKKGSQFTIALPKADVNAVSLNLADNIVSIKEVVLTNTHVIEGAVVEGAVVKADEKSVKPLATLKQITMADGTIALAEQKVSVQSLLFAGLETAVVRNADQSLNWLKVFEAKDRGAQPEVAVIALETPSKDESSAWEIELKKVALEDAAIHIQDNSAPTPMKMDIEKASLEIQNASLDMAKPLPIKAAFKVKQGGKFSTKGQLWPAPFKAELGLRLSNLSLKPFAPYVNQFALLKLNSGATDVSGKLRLKQQEDFSLDFNGKFDVKKLALVEEADNVPFLSWDHLASNQLKVSLKPNKLHMATLKVVKPSGKFIINEDKSTNINRILRSSSKADIEPVTESADEDVAHMPVKSGNSLIQTNQGQGEPAIKPPVVNIEKETKAAPPSSAATSTSDTFPISIDAIRVSDGKLEFADLSLTPQFGTNIHSLSGVINGLSTGAAKVAQVEMDGKVDAYGSARIRGSLQPFNATEFTDIKLAFTNLDMSRLTPYSGKFAGRYIDSGKLSVDLGYKIKQQQLIGENKLIINKIKLGEKVESPDAADLPLDLAIAILEDSDGVIDLDLPISGSLNDPEFSYGSIIWKAFSNILTKIVTAPFRALGSIFGAGAEEFDGIAFEAGISDIAPPELEKLAKVSEALAKRQGLSLGVVPSYNNALDTQAIKEATYRKQVTEEMDIELEEGQRAGPVDLTNEKAQDAIDTLHDKLTKKGFLKRMVSKFDKPEDGHYEKAQASLIASIEVTESDLKALAEARGKAIQDALIANGISENRLQLMDVVDAKAEDANVKTALTLDVNKSAAKIIEPAPEELSQEGPTAKGMTPKDQSSPEVAN